MTCMERLMSMFLRSVEVTFAVIVAGITGDYLHRSHGTPWELGRFIYTETLAGVSILCAMLWLFPFSSTFVHWPVDLGLSLAWWAAFALIVLFVGDDCGGTFDWGNIAFRGDQCGKFKTDIAFSFLSAILWLLSATIGFAWVRRHESLARRAESAHAANRHRWFGV